MHNQTTRRFSLFCGLLTLLLFGPQASASLTNVVRFSQGDRLAVTSGELLTIDLIGENFTLAPDGAAFSLQWDPGVLSYVSSAVANPPWESSFINEAHAASGLIDYAFMSITNGSNAGSDFGIARFTFSVLGNAGDISALALGNDAYSIGFLKGVTGLDVNFVNSQVQVVPLPAAAWMFGAGLVGMAGSMKRRRPK